MLPPPSSPLGVPAPVIAPADGVATMAMPLSLGVAAVALVGFLLKRPKRKSAVTTTTASAEGVEVIVGNVVGVPITSTNEVARGDAWQLNDAALAAQKDTVEAKKLVESTAMGASQASEKKLQEESSAKSLAVEKLGHMQTEKVAIESAFAEHFKPMEDGEASAKAHLKKLEPFLKKIEIESTLLTALPSTCAKLKEKRGTFDNLVLVELDKAFKLKIAALGDAIAAEGPAAVQRDASLQAAENDHAAKTAALTGAEKEARASEQELAARETSLTNAKQAVDDFGPQVEEVTGRLSSAQLALAEFEAGPLTNFTSFKTRVAALPEEPAADEASEPQAAAADEEPQAAAADEEPAAAA